jgi:phosphomevalonate kinase
LDVQLRDVHKTGLGSSAALITSLVSSLLLHFSVISREDFTEGTSGGKNMAHNIAQFVHCLAQGKVGSGFDVSAAVFGSQRYTRFDPIRLQSLMEGDAVCVFLITHGVAYMAELLLIDIHSSQHDLLRH